MNLDFSVFRQFPIRERMRFEIRVEGFNIFNHPVYAVPNADMADPSTLGQVFSTANTARVMQIAAKFIF